MTKHSILSASASGRWILCPPSARLCEGLPEDFSPLAQEGIDAHKLAEYLLKKLLKKDVRDPTADLTWYNPEMQKAAEGYLDFIILQLQILSAAHQEVRVMVECPLDFSGWVPEGFGTADTIVMVPGLLWISDFKYGKGYPVSAGGSDGSGNPQLKCYALGALAAYDQDYHFEKIRLSVFQPRRHISETVQLFREDLLVWADQVLAPAARLAYEGKGDFSPGEHCRFCKARAVCRARAAQAMDLMKVDCAKAPTLSIAEIADILPKADRLLSWTNDVRSYALSQALAGTRYPGLKIVEGQSFRHFKDEEAVVRLVSEAGYDPWNYELKSPHAMSKMMGRKRFEELLGSQVIRPRGKPLLVPVSDPRPEWIPAELDFDDETFASENMKEEM